MDKFSLVIALLIAAPAFAHEGHDAPQPGSWMFVHDGEKFGVKNEDICRKLETNWAKKGHVVSCEQVK